MLHQSVSSVGILLVNGLISGCGCQGFVSASTADLLLLTWAHPPLLVWGGKEKCFFLALFGCRDSGYKSKNTNSDPQEGFAIHCSTSRVFCRAFLIHKAAACKWAKTLPKSWRSKKHQQGNGSMSLLGLWAVRCVWYWQTWLENENTQCCLLYILGLCGRKICVSAFKM